MASQSWGQLIAGTDTAGTLYNTYTTAKSIFTSATATGASEGFITLPPGFFRKDGKLEIDLMVGLSWASGNTNTIQVMVGSVIAFTSDALKVTTTGGTTEPLIVKIELTCRSVGNGTLATLQGHGFAIGRGICSAGATAGANYAAAMGFANLKEGVPAVGTGFDSTVANTLDIFWGMGTSAAGNGVQIQNYRVVSWGNTGF